MFKNLRVLAADVREVSRLALDGVVGVVDLIEAMHHNIATIPGILPRSKGGRTTGITRLGYRSIHGVVGLTGHGMDRLLTGLEPLLQARLAPTLGARRGGIALPDEHPSQAAAIPRAGGKLVVLLHGLSMNDLQWNLKGHDDGAALTRGLPYTPV